MECGTVWAEATVFLHFAFSCLFVLPFLLAFVDPVALLHVTFHPVQNVAGQLCVHPILARHAASPLKEGRSPAGDSESGIPLGGRVLLNDRAATVLGASVFISYVVVRAEHVLRHENPMPLVVHGSFTGCEILNLGNKKEEKEKLVGAEQVQNTESPPPPPRPLSRCFSVLGQKSSAILQDVDSNRFCSTLCYKGMKEKEKKLGN